MSQVETSLGGNPLRTINASSGPEPYTLPALAAGRSVTILREDSSGNAVTITVPAGHYLDGILNGSKTLPPDSETAFKAINPGVWESYGSGGGGGLTGFGGGAVTTTVQVASDAALTGTFARISKTGVLTRDGNGRITAAVENGVTHTYGRDGSGRITTDTNGATSEVTTYARDGAGRVSSWATV